MKGTCIGSGWLGLAQQACGIARYDRARGNILGDYAARSDSRPFANFDSAKNRGAGTNRGSFPDDGRDAFPIGIRLLRAVRVRCPRKAIVDKGHIMSDEYLIFDRDSFANERMARDFATTAHASTFLNFDERPNLGVIANFATVEIRECEDLDPLAKLHVRRNALIKLVVIVHAGMRVRSGVGAGMDPLPSP